MRILLLFLFICSYTISLLGQCPDRVFLWHRIIYLRDSSEVPKDKQLKELNSYLEKTKGCTYQNDSAYALLLQRIGWLYSTQHDFYNAAVYTNKSIQFINQQQSVSLINTKHLVKAYYNLSLIYDSLKLPTKKNLSLDSCISISLRHKVGYEFTKEAIAGKIIMLIKNGDYYSCIDYANLGEGFINDNATKIDGAFEVGLDYFTWKINALIFLEKTEVAENLLERKIVTCEKENRINNLAALFALLGRINRKKGDASKALSYYKKAFESNKKINYSMGCSEALNNIGFVFSEMLRQNKKALYYYFKALKFADANEALNTYDNIANMYTRAGNFDSAFFYFQKAFDQVKPGFSEAGFLSKDAANLDVNITEYASGLVLDKGDAWLFKYKKDKDAAALRQAIKIYQTADVYFDKIKNAQSEIQSKLFWKTNNRRLYEHAIEACYASRNIETAFYFFERSRSVLLNEQINEQRAMSENEIAGLAQLQKNMHSLENNLLYTAPNSKEFSSLQQQLFSAKQQLENLNNALKNKQSLNAAKSFDANLLALELVRKNILVNKDLLLEIFTGDSAVYVLSVSKQTQLLQQINKQQYDQLTSSYISFITNPEKLNSNFIGFQQVAQQLFQLLFQQIILPPSGSIIISPDGKSFPFEALITSSCSDKQPNYFLYNYTCSYTYSAAYLLNQLPSNTSSSNTLLGFAPVNFNAVFKLPSLSGSDASLKKIGKYYSSNNFIFDKANKKNFLDNYSGYAILQLYTHAAENSSNNEPVIYFADSALYLSELIAFGKPSTQLVVLSACETANGKLYAGEGIFNFNRAFAAMGIPAAISNLWAVADQPTYRITELFYKYLAEGLPTDIALQKAKIEFIKNVANKEETLPYYWAGIILTGKPAVLKTSSPVLWYWLAAGVATILLFYFGYKQFRKRN